MRQSDPNAFFDGGPWNGQRKYLPEPLPYEIRVPIVPDIITTVRYKPVAAADTIKIGRYTMTFPPRQGYILLFPAIYDWQGLE